MYEKFKHPRNNNLYAFIEAPVELLNIEVPVGAKWSSVITGYDENGEPITRQKTMSEFLLHKIYSLDGTKVLVLLSAMQSPVYRIRGVNESDLNDWDLYLTPYNLNYASGAWMTIDEYKVKLNSIEYNEEI